MASRLVLHAERPREPSRLAGVGSALQLALLLASAGASAGCMSAAVGDRGAEPRALRSPSVGAPGEPPYRILGPTAPSLAPEGSSGGAVAFTSFPVRSSTTQARCPADMALVDDRLCVDKWEASIVLFEGGQERPHSPYEPLDGVTAPYRAVSRPGVVPHGYISGAQAMSACRASGKRLCTAGEWERACRGPRGTQYPYGDDRRAGACNDDVRASHPVVEAARRLGVPAEQTWTTGMNLALVNQLPDGLAAAGARASCETPEGVYDLVGNLHEWIADGDGTFRGGFYMDTTQNGEGCAYQTTAHDFDYHDYSTGFRCCSHADGVE